MTGGLMQLVAYGAQDIYLTGNPMITYFKVVYRRHTNFAMESIEQTFSGNVGFGNTVTALISRNGDLVSGLCLEVVLPHLTVNTDTSTRWTDSVGHYIVEEVKVEIGGQQIDKHYSDWLEIWAQLSMPLSQRSAYFELIGLDGAGRGLQDAPAGGAATRVIHPGGNLDVNGHRVLYVPLQFWFCRNVGLALPLIALQYHEVKVAVKIRSSAELYCSGTGAGTSGTFESNGLEMKLWADYIYLDTDERRRFAQVSHEYLIEQLQYQSFSYTTTSVSAKLNYNHPVKELVWACRETNHTSANQWANFTQTLASAGELMARPNTTSTSLTAVASKSGMDAIRNTDATSVSENLVQKAKLKLNGHDRFAEREGVYFNRWQPLRHHTASPASPGINVYSFALKPEDHQPSGTCNFSRIDNAQLEVTLHVGATGGILHVYAVNYNVLRIMSGMGGLAYSN